MESDVDRIRVLRKKHQLLLRDWKEKKGSCIICGEREGNEKDHLPPKALFPKPLRTSSTEFFTFPVCTECNRGSSDNDFLTSVFLTLKLNEISYAKSIDPDDTDLLVLHNEMERRLDSADDASKWQRHFRPFLKEDEHVQGRVDPAAFSNEKTLIKIAKSIYWMHSSGDISQIHNPGWWVKGGVDTARMEYIDKHFKITNSDLHWEDKFIAHYAIGLPGSGADGFISVSLSFYTNRKFGEGYTWHVIGAPFNVDDKSIFKTYLQHLGRPDLPPRYNY